MSGYTRLERTVMDALARELHGQVPDLAAQFAASRPTVRRNSGFGVFTEMLVPPERPVSGPTDELGTVHVMVAGLPDPVAFRVRLRNGRLLGLLGDSYGRDTRAIDFAAVVFDQVFTVDASGRSVPFHIPDAAPLTSAVSRSRAVAAPATDAPTPVYIPPRRQQVEQPAAPAVPAPLPPSGEPVADLSAEERTTLRVGLWAGLFAIGSVLVLLFDAPIPFVLIAAFVAGRFFQTDRGLDLLRRTMASLQQATRQEQA
jgi:hypothetical protein